MTIGAIAIPLLIGAAGLACGPDGRERAIPGTPASTRLPGTQASSSNPAAAAATRPSKGSHGPAGSVVQVQMRNVDLHVDDTIILHIRGLRGELIGRKNDEPPVFDDEQSYVLSIDSGQIEMSPASLTDLMNRYVFASPQSPLKDIHISIEGRQLKQKGVLRKGISIPFTMVADVGVTPDGRMLLRADRLKTVGIPVRGLLHFFGLEMDDLMSLKDTHGVTVKENELVVDPARILPPPQVRGRLTAVRVERDRIVQVFGPPGRAAKPPLSPPVPRANYMYYRGGTLGFGKLIMSDADMQLIDADPADPFDFYPDRYHEQLVAGYSKNTSARGLKVFMPDYNQVSRGVDLAPRRER